MVVDGGFFAANMAKVLEGGYVPLLLAAAVYGVMWIWHRGATRGARPRRRRAGCRPRTSSPSCRAGRIARVPGSAVFLTRAKDDTPPVLAWHVRKNRSLHEYVLALTLTVVSTPRVEAGERADGDARSPTNTGAPRRATASWSSPTFPRVVAECKAKGAEIDLADVTYYVGHETIVPREDGAGLPRLAGSAVRRDGAQRRPHQRLSASALRPRRRDRPGDRDLERGFAAPRTKLPRAARGADADRRRPRARCASARPGGSRPRPPAPAPTLFAAICVGFQSRALDAKAAPSHHREPMPTLVVPFPTINPILFQWGPLAIRWYALAYIAGLTAGWALIRRYRRPTIGCGAARRVRAAKASTICSSIAPSASSSAGGWATCCSTIRAITSPIRSKIFEVWEGGMAFHGGLIGAALGIALFARRHQSAGAERDGSLRAGRADRALPRPHRQFHQAGTWGRPTDVPWAMIFPGSDGLPRHPSQIYEALLEGLVLLRHPVRSRRARGALRRPGLIAGAFGVALRRGAHLLRVLSRARSAPRGSRRRPDHGHGLSAPLIVVGLGLIAWSLREAARERSMTRPRRRDQGDHRQRRPDHRRALHGARARPSRARLLHEPRSVRRARATSPPRRKSRRCSAS